MRRELDDAKVFLARSWESCQTLWFLINWKRAAARLHRTGCTSLTPCQFESVHGRRYTSCWLRLDLLLEDSKYLLFYNWKCKDPKYCHGIFHWLNHLDVTSEFRQILYFHHFYRLQCVHQSERTSARRCLSQSDHPQRFHFHSPKSFHFPAPHLSSFLSTPAARLN